MARNGKSRGAHGHDIHLERAREQNTELEGHRVLVDRVWPRGIKKADLALDERLPDIAPSPELRRWFAHDPAKWDEFQQRYHQELDDRPEPVAHLQDVRRECPLILVYDTRDPEHNHATALRAYLLERNDRR